MDRKVQGEGQASEEDWKVWFSSTMFQYYNGGQFEFQKNIIDMAAESLWQMLYQVHLTKWGNQDFSKFFCDQHWWHSIGRYIFDPVYLWAVACKSQYLYLHQCVCFLLNSVTTLVDWKLQLQIFYVSCQSLWAGICLQTKYVESWRMLTARYVILNMVNNSLVLFIILLSLASMLS